MIFAILLWVAHRGNIRECVRLEQDEDMVDNSRNILAHCLYFWFDQCAFKLIYLSPVIKMLLIEIMKAVCAFSGCFPVFIAV